MKLALCLYGFLRSFRQTASSWTTSIINEQNIDIFISCPSTYYADGNLEQINEQHIRDVFGDKLKCLDVREDDTEMLKKTSQAYNFPEHSFVPGPGSAPPVMQIPWRILGMFYSIKKTMDAKIAYQQTHDIKYDAVFLSRPDICITTPPNLAKVNLNKITHSIVHNAPVHGFNKTFGDHCIVSNSNNIDLTSSIYDNIPNYVNNDGILINNETLYAYHFIKHGIEFEHSNFIMHHVNTNRI